MPRSESAERQRVLNGVMHHGGTLRDAPEEFKSDREVVLAAVRCRGPELQHASEHLKRDREVVLAAVQQTGFALKHAAKELKRDREVVLAAMKEVKCALHYAAEELLLDSDFARQTKEECHILKVSLLSGRYVYHLSKAADIPETAEFIVQWCCWQFGLKHQGTEALVHGDVVVPQNAYLANFPGMQPLGQISEYQLVVGALQKD
mmetsp:Transcript_8279/g.14839  ORF Transcript_8279/g.14839 Transcript_8279/m.14839 type:complete len:205 (-) Transcript_8279:135-749(-)